MLLMIEGPDMVGKSELAGLMAGTTGMCIEKFGMAERDDMIGAVRARVADGVVLDRCWVSELVYSAVTGRAPAISREEADEARGQFRRAGGVSVIVVATPDAYEQLIRENHARGEQFDADTCRRVNAAYWETARTRRAMGVEVPVDIVHRVDVMDSGRLAYPSGNRELVRELHAAAGSAAATAYLRARRAERERES